MKTKFTIKAFFPPILSIIFIFIVSKFSYELYNNPFYQQKIIFALAVLLFFVFTLLWLILGEVKNKFIIVEFEPNKITVARMLGLLPTVEYRASEIIGWKYSYLSSKGGTYEYLYLYIEDKKAIKISEFYHKNYQDIKGYIGKNYKSLGFEQFSYIDEVKEIFV